MADRKDVLYTCSYLPVEIIKAAGFRPVRVATTARPSDADAAIHPTTCPYIRAVYAAIARGDGKNAAGMVIVNSCDGIRRLYDALAALRGGPPVLFLDVPAKQDEAAVDLFTDILGRFVRRIEEVFSTPPITPAALEAAIADRNAQRREMAELFDLQARGEVSGGEVFSLLVQAATGDSREVSGRIDGRATARRDNAANGRKRIIVSANVLDRPDLVGMVEGAGGAVVALDSCIGRRQWEGPVAEGTSDPIRAIAQRYLTRVPCPRMEGIGRRIEWLAGLAGECRADAVVLSSVKYCDAWLYDLPLLTENLQRAGIRVLALENDYEWSGAGQTKTRIEAFLETLPAGGK